MRPAPFAPPSSSMTRGADTNGGFRGDINGLRAWAVSAVCLYHFGVPGFGGGFVGVDVFFVISGFLMTGIVSDRLEHGRFSILDFYFARARRIVPALLVLCVGLLVLGWLLLLPPDYKMLGSHVVYASAFLSNVEFWQEAGYFDTDSHDKWLLHTWSLSVEWQFYMLLPLVLAAVWRLRPGRPAQRVIVGVGLCASLTVCLLRTAAEPSAAFYLLPSRAWEMLAGGAVFLGWRGRSLPSGVVRWLQPLGLLLIALAVTTIDARTAWPGWRALLPVAGSALVLAGQRPNILLDAKPWQWLGARSYSIYLWHWPLCVLLAYGELQDRPLAIAAGLAATLLLGDASFRWVEGPARRHLQALRRPAFAAALATGLMIAALPAVAVWRGKGVEGRFDPRVERAAAEEANFNKRRQDCYSMGAHVFPACAYGGTQPGVVGIGDSHLSSVMSALAQARIETDTAAVEWSYRGCPYVTGLKPAPPFDSEASDGYTCAQFNARVTEELARLPPQMPVVLVARYAKLAFGTEPPPSVHDGGAPADEALLSGRPQVFFSTPQAHATPQFLAEFGQHITATACALAARHPVYLVRPIPEASLRIPRVMARRMVLGRDADIGVSLASYRQRNDWVWAAQDAARAQCGVHILDPLPYLCRAGRCDTNRDGRPLYIDSNHLSEYGNKLLVPMFAEVWRAR